MFLGSLSMREVAAHSHRLIKRLRLLALVVNWIDGGLIKLSMVLRADFVPIMKLSDFWKILGHWILEMLLSLHSHLHNIWIRELTSLHLFFNSCFSMIRKPRAWQLHDGLLLLSAILLFIHFCGRCSSLKRHHVIIIVGILILGDLLSIFILSEYVSIEIYRLSTSRSLQLIGIG